VSDGENTRSLAGLLNRARRFLPGGARAEPAGWDDVRDGAVRPSRTLRAFVEANVDQPFARRDGAGLERALAARLVLAPGSVSGVLAWDVFDYLDRAEAAMVSGRLVSLLRPGGLLMALFTTEVRHEAASRRYVIADADHLRHRPAPGARWARKVWPLRDIEVLLAPLEVVQSHLLAHHQREMLLRRPAAPGKEG
jgi:hypothetical protein